MTTTDLNVRGGPHALPVLGTLRAGQSAEISGVSVTAAGRIKVAGVPGERAGFRPPM
jgi:uncharacterized protein YraI